VIIVYSNHVLNIAILLVTTTMNAMVQEQIVDCVSTEPAIVEMYVIALVLTMVIVLVFVVDASPTDALGGHHVERIV